MFKLLKEYATLNNNIDVPQRAIFKGKNLGRWVLMQRRKKVNKDTYGGLTKKRERKLNSVNFIWFSPRAKIKRKSGK